MTGQHGRGDEIIELGGGIFGLLSRPQGAPRTPCVVLLNAGFLPRWGPFRLHVRLARRLAAHGYPVFRFDLPGVGDTLALADRPLTLILREVLDALRSLVGYERFIVGGICAAADIAWQTALADPRVVGVILLDGLARPTWSYKLSRVQRALRAPVSTWPGKVRRLLARPDDDSTAPANALLRDWPAPGAERTQLQTLVERGVELFFLYTGGTSYFLHARQFIETFGPAARSGHVQFHHWPQCDHVFYDVADRDELIATVTRWLERPSTS